MLNRVYGLYTASLKAAFAFCSMSLRADSPQCGGYMGENENNDIKESRGKKSSGKSGEKNSTSHNTRV